MPEEIRASQRLTDYLNKIEKETGRPIRLAIMKDSATKGKMSSFREHPTHIYITIPESCQLTDPETESSIAHEATHGLLYYKKGFPKDKYRDTISASKGQHFSLIFNAIDDTVVSKILQDEDFNPYGKFYFHEVQRETKAIRRDKDAYSKFSKDPSVKSGFMIARYFLAWGALKYLGLAVQERKILKKFLKAFQKAYSHQTKKVNRIIKIVQENDIFVSEGNYAVKREILDIWDNEKIVILAPV